MLTEYKLILRSGREIVPENSGRRKKRTWFYLIRNMGPELNMLRIGIVQEFESACEHLILMRQGSGGFYLTTTIGSTEGSLEFIPAQEIESIRSIR